MILKPEVTIEGLKVITHADEVMRIVREMIEQKTELVPEGWMTKTGLSEKLRIDVKTTLDPIVNQYKEERPEWFQLFLDRRHRLSEFLSPEFIQKVKRDLDKEGLEGWYTLNAISRKTKVNFQRIKKIAEEYRELHPNWFALLRSLSGHSHEHYAPPLVEIITKEIERQKVQMAPKDWLTVSKLRQEFKVGYDYIRKIVEEYRVEHPEWFVGYEKSGQKVEHCAPELVREIRERIAQMKPIPDVRFGWMNVAELVKERKRGGRLTIEKIADEYRLLHPEWFEQQRNKKNRVFEYCSPELVAEIKKRLGMET